METALHFLDEALDAGAYAHIEKESPQLAVGIRKALQEGVTPGAIRHHVAMRTLNPKLAGLCEQAAYHIEREMNTP